MVRVWVALVVVAVIFTLYALVDAAMADPKRARGVSKPIWIVVIVLLPVVGGALWFTLGRGKLQQRRVLAPDDDPSFIGKTDPDLDERIRDIERELAALDEETFTDPRKTPPSDEVDAGDAAPDGSADPAQAAPANDEPNQSIPTDGSDPEADRPNGSRSADD
ncbi:PLDc N-terminal domain-containing protein [Lysinibacter cavernae]|uniref:Cardiolipin synthase N-terminal domain-containing protein n=1 Tax=Lysinibacter cavernae TaxID=1640652 RepID=A0A7X5R277_9MICO|nr:PLDc N-terminal domain-containing protein [Lysinibacter cavernae]NIH54077.1 hypothetical protein [Lysinibacter cavernae]